MSMILEGIVTTWGADNEPNIAPMGPLVDDALLRIESLSRLILRPFRTSTTYANLQRLGAGVFHVTDDVELLARAAVDRIDVPPPMRAAACVPGSILVDACRWFEFRVEQLDDRDERTRIDCVVVGGGQGREFLGFNRASHAVLEAAILATRLHLIPVAEVDEELRRLAVVVDKTAGHVQRRAFDFLKTHIAEQRR